ncbi:MAG: family 20 glycosylhydrolase [Victivallales bacterium]|nr:family 20 glycosylhydrolase [Victivallales bacterium]
MTDPIDNPLVPGLVPEPRDISLLGGDSELSQDVRLVTSNVLPMQRKAMRGILTSAGIRVVANKKKYVIEAKVLDVSEFDLAGVPEDVQAEYYELEIQGSLIFIRSPGQLGVLWATQTLAAIFRQVALEEPVPNCLVRDWPEMADRGIFVECKWGPDRMDVLDWSLVIDRLAAMKMNRLGVGLYGCWGNCRFEGTPTEFLMVPMPEEEELKSEKHLRWYSPDLGEWQDETYLPRMFEDDFFGEVVRYGAEKGVTVVPFVNSLGHNTLIPRLKPELSAKNADGTPTGVGYSIANPKTREFIEAFYGSIIERYYPDGIDLFHIQMDEVWPDYPDPADPNKVGSPWCEAPESTAKSNEENLRDYILWLIKMLTDKGVGKVVMWNDQLTRHMDVLNDDFVAELEKAGLKERLILHWWWYSNEALNDQTHVAIGKELGLEGWVAPMTCYFNWSRYDPRRPNIEKMMDMARDEGAKGAISYSVHDPAFADHEALMANCAWTGKATPREKFETVFAMRFREGKDAFLAAMTALQDAHVPALGPCYHYAYTYTNKDVAFPRDYPGEAIARLKTMEGAAEQLRGAADKAAEAAKVFAELSVVEEYIENDRACARSLYANAARVQGLATVFAALLDLDAGKADKAALAAARETLLAAMAVVEKNQPDWVAPASLMSLSVLLEAIDQL